MEPLTQRVTIRNSMKTIIITILAIIILSSGLTIAEPRLDLDYKDYDFGWVPHNSVAVQYCIIRSVGTDTLIINDITSSHYSIVTLLEGQILPPGDTMIIPVVWKFGEETGKKTQFCRIFTNEEASIAGKPIQLKFEGIVISNPGTLHPVSSKPYRLEFSRLGEIDIDSLEFALTNNSIRNLCLEVIAHPFKECEISIPDSLKPNSTATGWVKIRPEYVDSEFLTSITIRMTDDMRFDRSLTIPIRRKLYSK